MNQLLRRDGRERGAGLIELALVLPMLLLMFAAIVDFGLLFQRYAVISNAAREGARIAVLPGYSQTDVQNRVTQYVQQSTGDSTLSPTTTVTTVSIKPSGTAPAFSAAQVNVSLTHSYLVIGPVSALFGGGSWTSITLNVRSTMRIES